MSPVVQPNVPVTVKLPEPVSVPPLNVRLLTDELPATVKLPPVSARPPLTLDPDAKEKSPLAIVNVPWTVMEVEASKLPPAVSRTVLNPVVNVPPPVNGTS